MKHFFKGKKNECNFMQKIYFDKLSRLSIE